MRLKNRVAGQPMPPVKIVDLRTESSDRKGFHAISRGLEKALAEALVKGEQGILFLNRRGFSTHIFCPRCGFAERCPDCDVGMTYHLRPGHLRCHYCGRKATPPKACPSCGLENINYWGLGTQKLEEEIKDKLPEARLARMDSDTMRRRGAHEEILTAFHEGDIDILIGTQMIAKGLHFPNCTVVGIINADAALNLPDFRAAERCFQLISQVAGRTGRGAKAGQVFLQTFNPEHTAIRLAAAHDYDSFFRKEMEARRRLGYPPLGRLARIVGRGENADKVEAAIKSLAGVLRDFLEGHPVVILGPAPTPIAKISRHWRYQILVKSPDAKSMMHFMDAVRSKIKPTSDVQFAVDIDPQSTL
ncbi:MAG: primosomal protein N' [Phycisphaerae bacterium]|nr:primosomal protein N' [Phycisphaerae bacterium]